MRAKYLNNALMFESLMMSCG